MRALIITTDHGNDPTYTGTDHTREYDLTQPIADSRENAMILGGLLPCEYGAKQIILSKRKIYKYINKIPLTAYEQMELDKSLMLSFIIKSSSWKYENEWRLLSPVDICKYMTI